jgi:hypothetical protein
MGIRVLAGSQTDIQVEAMIGYVHRVIEGNSAPWVFTGETSGWSETQTISIPANTPLNPTSTPPTSPSQSPTPTPYQEPQQTELTEAIVGGVIAIVVIGAGLGLLIYLIKRK